jgi:hypothetical protein
VDVFSPREFTAAILECYRQIEGVCRFLKERVPGFEAARLGQVSPILGVRETRHILGEYTLTGPDSRGETRFADTIAADNSALDIHDPKGGDVDFQSMPPYEIPYRCLVPQGVDQILVAGRCISADHEAHARSRNMPACMSIGQAAGVAAAIAVEEGVSVRHVPIGKVQAALRELGMPLHAEDVPA